MSKSGNIWHSEVAIQISRGSAQRILESGILSREGVKSALFESAVTHFLIVLNDLLQAADHDGRRVSFDVGVHKYDIKDITDLISKCRNVSCHSTSKIRFTQDVCLHFNVVVGKIPNAIRIGDEVLGCDYEDDVAIYWGNIRLYLYRHMLEAHKIICDYYECRS